MNDQDLAEYEALLRQGTANQGLARNLDMQKLQAETLRKMGQAPQGQMVSGHYVAPSITQNLASLFANYGAGKANQQQLDTGKQMDTNTAAQNAAVLRMLISRQQPTPGAVPQQGMEPGPYPVGY